MPSPASFQHFVRAPEPLALTLFVAQDALGDAGRDGTVSRPSLEEEELSEPHLQPARGRQFGLRHTLAPRHVLMAPAILLDRHVADSQTQVPNSLQGHPPKVDRGSPGKRSVPGRADFSTEIATWGRFPCRRRESSHSERC